MSGTELRLLVGTVLKQRSAPHDDARRKPVHSASEKLSHGVSNLIERRWKGVLASALYTLILARTDAYGHNTRRSTVESTVHIPVPCVSRQAIDR